MCSCGALLWKMFRTLLTLQGACKEPCSSMSCPQPNGPLCLQLLGALLVGMEQEPRTYIVLPTSSRDPQICSPLEKLETCQRSCSKWQEMPANVEQGQANLPEVILPKHWVRCIKHPATTGGPLCIVSRVCDANVLGQASQDDRQHHSVAPGAGVTHIHMISARLHLQEGTGNSPGHWTHADGRKALSIISATARQNWREAPALTD